MILILEGKYPNRVLKGYSPLLGKLRWKWDYTVDGRKLTLEDKKKIVQEAKDAINEHS